MSNNTLHTCNNTLYRLCYNTVHETTLSYVGMCSDYKRKASTPKPLSEALV